MKSLVRDIRTFQSDFVGAGTLGSGVDSVTPLQVGSAQRDLATAHGPGDKLQQKVDLGTISPFQNLLIRRFVAVGARGPGSRRLSGRAILFRAGNNGSLSP